MRQKFLIPRKRYQSRKLCGSQLSNLLEAAYHKKLSKSRASLGVTAMNINYSFQKLFEHFVADWKLNWILSISLATKSQSLSLTLARVCRAPASSSFFVAVLVPFASSWKTRAKVARRVRVVFGRISWIIQILTYSGWLSHCDAAG